MVLLKIQVLSLPYFLPFLIQDVYFQKPSLCLLQLPFPTLHIVKNSTAIGQGGREWSQGKIIPQRREPPVSFIVRTSTNAEAKFLQRGVPVPLIYCVF